MSDQERAEFFERYAPIAIDQQQKYGIPASVTLSQMALESAYGESRLSREGLNFFGVKAHDEYGQAGRFGYYSDDRPNEKFCHYSSVAESVQDHTRILMKDRYAACRRYGSTDYHHWLLGIKAAGYATAVNYVESNEALIQKFSLGRYDQMAVAQATQPIGYMRGQSPTSVSYGQPLQPKRLLAFEAEHWSMPVAPDSSDTIMVSSGYGRRAAPTQGASTNHKGIDISVNNAAVFATEDNGRITKVGSNSSEGNYIQVEYTRQDGTKYETSYLHLSQVNVHEGDTVNAGTRLGTSGNTGISTGPHLDFRVKTTVGGQMQNIDPSLYLAEISVRGGLSTQLKEGNTDLLARYKSTMAVSGDSPVTPSQADRNQAMLAQLSGSNNPADWLAYLMNNDRSKDGLSLGGGGDLIANIAGTLLSGVMLLASQIEGSNMTKEEVSDLVNGKDGDKSETDISESTLIQRSREGVSPTRAQQLASMNYDQETAQQRQQQQIQLS